MKKTKYNFFFQGFHFLKYNKFSRGGVLLFLKLALEIAELLLRKYKKCFLLRKYKESFPLKEYKKFLILELKGLISRFIRTVFFWENIRKAFFNT